MPYEKPLLVREYNDTFTETINVGPVQAATFNSANTYFKIPWIPERPFVIDEITAMVGVKASAGGQLSLVALPAGTAYAASSTLAVTVANRVTGNGVTLETATAGGLPLNSGSITAWTPFNLALYTGSDGFGNVIPAGAILLLHCASAGATSLVDLVVNITGRTRRR